MLFNYVGLQKLILSLKLDKLLEININFGILFNDSINILTINSFKMFFSLANFKLPKQLSLKVFDTLLLQMIDFSRIVNFFNNSI